MDYFDVRNGVVDPLGSMRVFVAVAEAQGFAPAARRLSMSPPAITRAIAALEKTRGENIFDSAVEMMLGRLYLQTGAYATAVPMVAIVTVFGTMAFSPLERAETTLVPFGIGIAVLIAFVLEAASVVIQVFFYKRTGRRVFRMAPIHHHFEHLGWSEPTVVIRFWIISFILALAGLSTLKLR